MSEAGRDQWNLWGSGRMKGTSYQLFQSRQCRVGGLARLQAPGHSCSHKPLLSSFPIMHHYSVFSRLVLRTTVLLQYCGSNSLSNGFLTAPPTLQKKPYKAEESMIQLLLKGQSFSICLLHCKKFFHLKPTPNYTKPPLSGSWNFLHGMAFPPSVLAYLKPLSATRTLSHWVLSYYAAVRFYYKKMQAHFVNLESQ